MSITVNGQSSVPPGFRFHPTEEELLNYYLRKKVASEKIDLDVIRDVDLNKLEPWDIQEKCRIGSTPQNDWYFFSHKDKKYPTGTRTNRATAAGFWKATGRDKGIYSSFRRIGMRKTLVFYKGRAPHGQKSDWIMHEYRLDDQQSDDDDANLLARVAMSMGESMNQEDGWVVCRVFKKKNFLRKSSDSSTTMVTMDTKLDFQSPNGDGTLDQIIECMEQRVCKQIEPRNPFFLSERYMKLPPLESYHGYENSTSSGINNQGGSGEVGLTDWVALDRLVASQLNGQSSSKQITCFNENMIMDYYGSDNNISEEGSGGDGDLWSLASSSA